MTFGDLKRPLRTLYLSEPTTTIWVKEDIYYTSDEDKPMTVVSSNIRFIIYADIRRGSLERGVKWW